MPSLVTTTDLRSQIPTCLKTAAAPKGQPRSTTVVGPYLWSGRLVGVGKVWVGVARWLTTWLSSRSYWRNKECSDGAAPNWLDGGRVGETR